MKVTRSKFITFLNFCFYFDLLLRGLDRESYADSRVLKTLNDCRISRLINFQEALKIDPILLVSSINTRNLNFF